MRKEEFNVTRFWIRGGVSSDMRRFLKVIDELEFWEDLVHVVEGSMVNHFLGCTVFFWSLNTGCYILVGSWRAVY